MRERERERDREEKERREREYIHPSVECRVWGFGELTAQTEPLDHHKTGRSKVLEVPERDSERESRRESA
jgi:hypothetical protein